MNIATRIVVTTSKTISVRVYSMVFNQPVNGTFLNGDAIFDRSFICRARDVFISVEQRTPGNLDPDEWAILRRVIDLIQANAKGAELGPVLETIENALRSDSAKLI